MQKYIRPTSLTWWSAVVPLLCGLFMAFEPVHGMTDLAEAIKNATGMSAPVLINVGLAGIGLRGAIK
jgi:DMSO/TMAO reductase YedYZ heme-binding membrane subunit